MSTVDVDEDDWSSSDDNPGEISVIGRIIGSGLPIASNQQQGKYCRVLWSSHQSFQSAVKHHFATMSIVSLVQAKLAFGGFMGTTHRRACSSLDTNDEHGTLSTHGTDDEN